jgi:hypothetical protein
VIQANRAAQNSIYRSLSNDVTYAVKNSFEHSVEPSTPCPPPVTRKVEPEGYSGDAAGEDGLTEDVPDATLGGVRCVPVVHVGESAAQSEVGLRPPIHVH